MYLLALGLLILIILWIAEYYSHQYYRKQIPEIIHINGTRGKSSVTRLVAAGLRAGGIKTIAKTTGSAPSLIFENGNETPIIRHHGANIKEQLKIIRFAAKRQIDALVLECMAVNPEYQWVTERKMVKSTIGVITNSRLDHLDLMGPGIRNVTLSLCNSLPYNGNAYTSEYKMFPLMEKQAGNTGTTLNYVGPESISDEDMQGFGHIEHKDNVALSLKICEKFGIARDVALKGMWTAKPDVGAAEVLHMKKDEREYYFVHSFAANDPESTIKLIKYVHELYNDLDSIVIILSTRADRMFRSEQLAEMIADLNFNHLVLIGDHSAKVKSYAMNFGIPSKKISSPGWVTGNELIDVLETLDAKRMLLFGVGNIHGNGGKIVKYFKERAIKNV